MSHNGIGDPLVRSQVLPYLRGLAERGIEVHLVTYERGPVRYPSGEFPRERWHPLRARRGAHLAAKALDALGGVVKVTFLVLRHRADLIHARSYLPAAIAAASGALTRRPYVFDMRGFLGEEYVDGGYWRPDDPRYRLLRLAEAWLLRLAREIVVLTRAAAERLRTEPRYAAIVRDTPVTVVPCTVDLELFRPREATGRSPTLVLSGALGLRNLLDEVLSVFAAARREVPDLCLVILNRGEHAMIREALARCGRAHSVVVRAAEYEEMPALLAGASVGIALQRAGRSKLGASAVKVAEYLASGLPVVVNAGHGDTDRLVREYRAGHVVEAYTEEELRAAGRAVARLLLDTEARINARRLAEAEYDLRIGVDRYATLYERLADHRRAD